MSIADRFHTVVIALALLNTGVSLIVGGVTNSVTELLIWNGSWMTAASIAILVRLAVLRNGNGGK